MIKFEHAQILSKKKRLLPLYILPAQKQPKNKSFSSTRHPGVPGGPAKESSPWSVLVQGLVVAVLPFCRHQTSAVMLNLIQHLPLGSFAVVPLSVLFFPQKNNKTPLRTNR
ncbi:MAG: hypothetical protein MR039_03085 [Elusimicrobia bacterium]|nr:hypothetical protein [Elusimicrobiota bacterium]